jgi:short-subunit dehydrogenase
VNVAVITGASSGIGRATAIQFARKGYDLAVLARRRELLDSLRAEILESLPERKVIAITCDVCKWTNVSDAFQTVEREFGVVNVLINNAGAYEYKPIETSEPTALDNLIDVNIRGVVYMTKAALPLLKKAASSSQWAKVVNVSSISGLWGFRNMSVYTATKFAVAGFSSGLRRELAPQGILVGTIFPGPVDTKVPTRTNGARKKLVMYPDEIAKQIHQLATSRRHNLVSHPAFRFLHALENLSPCMVDKLLKRIL